MRDIASRIAREYISPLLASGGGVKAVDQPDDGVIMKRLRSEYRLRPQLFLPLVYELGKLYPTFGHYLLGNDVEFMRSMTTASKTRGRPHKQKRRSDRIDIIWPESLQHGGHMAFTVWNVVSQNKSMAQVGEEIRRAFNLDERGLQVERRNIVDVDEAGLKPGLTRVLERRMLGITKPKASLPTRYRWQIDVDMADFEDEWDGEDDVGDVQMRDVNHDDFLEGLITYEQAKAEVAIGNSVVLRLTTVDSVFAQKIDTLNNWMQGFQF